MDLAKLEEEEAQALRTTRQNHGVVLPMSDSNHLDVDEASAAAASTEDSERNAQDVTGLNNHTT